MDDAARRGSGCATARRRNVAPTGTRHRTGRKGSTVATADDRRRGGGASRGSSGSVRKPASGSGATRGTVPRKAAPQQETGKQETGKQRPVKQGTARKPAPAQATARKTSARSSRSGERRVSATYLQAPGTSGRAAAVRRPAAGGGSRATAPRRPSPALVLAVAGALVAAGTLGGYGVGQAVDGVRAVWPQAQPDLPSDKVVPPDPIDRSGPASTCLPEALAVELTASARSVQVGSPLTFRVRVENVGRAPCLVDGSDASRAVTITDVAGQDRVWSSADCSGGEQLLLLGPGDVAPQRDVRWSSVRTVPGCAGGQPPVVPGEYQAQVTLADVPGATSEVVRFTVTAPPAPSPSAPTPSTSPPPAPSPSAPAATPATSPEASAEPAGG